MNLKLDFNSFPLSIQSNGNSQKEMKKFFYIRMFTQYCRELSAHYRKKIKNLTPKALVLLCVKITDKISATYGNHVAGNCKFNMFSYFLFYLATQHVLCSVYTAYYFWNENRIASIQPFTLFALAIPVSLGYFPN